MEKVNCNICGKNDTKKLARKNGFNIVKCRECGLVYINPRPTEDELEKLYSFKNYYRTMLNPYQEKMVLRSKKRRLDFIEKYVKNRGRILDVGCATGLFLKVTQERGWEAYGQEISNEAAEYAKRNYNLNVMTKKFEEATFPKDFFDIIAFQDSLEHMPNPFAASKRAYRLLKERGSIVISTPNINGWEPRLTYYLFYKTIKLWRHPEPPFHLYEFSEKTIQKLLKKIGFKKVTIIFEQIPLPYKAGLSLSKIKEPRYLLKFPLRVLYLMGIIPFYLLAKLFGKRDHMLLIARKS